MVLCAFVAGCSGHVLRWQQSGDPGPTPVDSVLPYLGLGVACSSVVVGPGILVTAAHCVHAARGEGTTGHIAPPGTLDQIQVVGTLDSPSADVSLLNAPTLRAPPVGIEYHPDVTRLWVAGYGCTGFTSLGIRDASPFGLSNDGSSVLLGQACHGDSGGGVFDVHGNLVAIMTAIVWEEWGAVAAIGVTPMVHVAQGLRPGAPGWVGDGPVRGPDRGPAR